MSVIGKIALQDIKLSLSLDQIALGELVLIGGDAQVVGVRCAYVPSFGPSKPGFLPLEGPNRYVFLEVPAGKRLPAIRVSKLAEMGLQSIAIDDTKRNLSLGDLCVLEEDESSALAVAIAFSADSGHLAGYLILQGSRTGNVIDIYSQRNGPPRLRLGKAVAFASPPLATP